MLIGEQVADPPPPLRLPFRAGERRLTQIHDFTPISHIVTLGDSIYLARGRKLSRVSTEGMALEHTQDLAASVTDMVRWLGKIRVAYGTSEPMQSSGDIDAAGDTAFADATKYATVMAVGLDRWWGTEANPNDAIKDRNRPIYSFDDLVSFDSGVRIADPEIPPTGLFTLDQFTVRVSVDPPYSSPRTPHQYQRASFSLAEWGSQSWPRTVRIAASGINWLPYGRNFAS